MRRCDCYLIDPDCLILLVILLIKECIVIRLELSLIAILYFP
jgi:hypothetical protein